LSREGGLARLDVCDDGPGIDEELKPRLFGRFERGKGPAGTAVSGSGLGLSLVKELVEAHDGSIRVYDVDPAAEGAKGALFRIDLPLAAGRPSLLPPGGDGGAKRTRSPHAKRKGIAPRPQDYGAAHSTPDLP